MASYEKLGEDLCKLENSELNSEFKIIMYQLVEAISSPRDISPLIGPIVKLLPTHNIKLKEVIYSVLPRVCTSQPETCLLIQNRVLADCDDPNPIIRKLSISLVCTLQSMFQEYVVKIIDQGLKDRDPSVRQATVHSCKIVHIQQPDTFQNNELVNELYNGIRDPDPIVVTECLLTLDTILAHEGGLVVNRNIAIHLLNRLAEFPDLQLATILQVLRKYKPKPSDLFFELSKLDSYLAYSSSSAVLVNCINLFLFLTKETHPQLKEDIISRSAPALLGFLNTSKESVNYVLEFLLEKCKEDSDWLLPFRKNFSLFYPQKSDSIAIIRNKFLFLPHIATEENFREILKSLKEKFCVLPRISEEAIHCIKCIGVKNELFFQSSVRVLVELLTNSDKKVITCTVFQLQQLDLSKLKSEDAEMIIHELVPQISEFKSIASILPVLISSNEHLIGGNSPLIMEQLLNSFHTYNNGTKNLLLTACLKLFLKQPAVYQHIMGVALEKCYNCDYELKHRAIKYYQLLKLDINVLKLMFNIQEVPSSEINLVNE